ncbi:MAG: hypothetical protein NVV82_29635 [Sporocytophaga sp.]|nr:hypothetical protein [Sporocytophaga sp.]
MRTLLFKHLLTALFAVSLITTLQAQRKPSDPKHENHYKVEPLDTDVLHIEFIDAHSQQAFTQVKLKITNKTEDFIYFKGNEPTFKYEFGEEHASGGGMFQGMNMVIDPKATETKTLKVSGGQNFHVEKLTLILDGFYRISSEGKKLSAPDFQLPASKNDFQAGGFTCNLEKIKKETKETSVHFKCNYTGSDVGKIEANKLVLKTESGQEFANENRKNKVDLVLPGEHGKIVGVWHIPAKTADMQFATMDIVWKDTFTESKMKPLKVGDVKFVLDPGLTDAKNK